MIELVIVSRLLEYPDAALWQHQQEMFEAIAASKNLSKEDAHALGIFLRDLTATLRIRKNGKRMLCVIQKRRRFYSS